MAQHLDEPFRFRLVHTLTRQRLELTLQQLYARTKNIYPGWSVRF